MKYTTVIYSVPRVATKMEGKLHMARKDVFMIISNSASKNIGYRPICSWVTNPK